MSDGSPAPLPPPTKESRRVGRLRALAASFAIGLVSLIGACAGQMPDASAPAPSAMPTPGELAAQLAQCKEGIEEWKKSAGQIDYPKTMELTIGQATAYNAAIDISDTPQPAPSKIMVPSGEATAQAVTVKCAVAARLRPVGDITVDPPTDQWETREFGPSGVVEWTWTVTASTSTDKTLVLEVQPAHLENGEPLVSGSGTQIARVMTQVQVKSTWIDRLKEWFEAQWPKLAGIVVLVGGSIAGAVRWLGLPWPPAKWFSSKKRPPKKPRGSPAGSPGRRPADKTPAGTG